MTRKETIKGMVDVYRKSPGYNFGEGMSAVLDFLRKEAVGEVYVEQSLMDRETGEWLQEVVLDGNDITGRTVALLTKP